MFLFNVKCLQLEHLDLSVVQELNKEIAACSLYLSFLETGPVWFDVEEQAVARSVQRDAPDHENRQHNVREDGGEVYNLHGTKQDSKDRSSTKRKNASCNANSNPIS